MPKYSWIDAGSDVTLVGNEPITYIVSIVPGTVLSVKGFKTFAPIYFAHFDFGWTAIAISAGIVSGRVVATSINSFELDSLYFI